MYDARLDQAIKELAFEKHNPDGSPIGRREFVKLGQDHERKLIGERFWDIASNRGIKVFTIEEVMKVINGEEIGVLEEQKEKL